MTYKNAGNISKDFCKNSYAIIQWACNSGHFHISVSYI